MKNVGNSSRGRSQGVPKIFMATMYRAHCAVVFAIAQLSCFPWLAPWLPPWLTNFHKLISVVHTQMNKFIYTIQNVSRNSYCITEPANCSH